MGDCIDYCSECVDLLGDYVDGTLPAEKAAALERHLGLCMPCITFLRTYKATGKLCRYKLALQMPVELKRSLQSFLASRVPGFAAPAPAKVDSDAPPADVAKKSN